MPVNPLPWSNIPVSVTTLPILPRIVPVKPFCASIISSMVGESTIVLGRDPVNSFMFILKNVIFGR